MEVRLQFVLIASAAYAVLVVGEVLQELPMIRPRGSRGDYQELRSFAG